MDNIFLEEERRLEHRQKVGMFLRNALWLTLAVGTGFAAVHEGSKWWHEHIASNQPISRPVKPEMK
jgi:hypothetical protein